MPRYVAESETFRLRGSYEGVAVAGTTFFVDLGLGTDSPINVWLFLIGVFDPHTVGTSRGAFPAHLEPWESLW